jgi:hypothetical protein
MKAFMMHSVKAPEQPPDTRTHTKQATKKHRQRLHGPDKSSPRVIPHTSRAMDTEYENNNLTNPTIHRPMDTSSRHTPPKPATDPQSDDANNMSPSSPPDVYASLQSQATIPRSGGQTPGRGGCGGRGALFRHLHRQHPTQAPSRDLTQANQISNYDLPDTSGWRLDPDSAEYDDQAVEVFEGGKGADDDNKWNDDSSGGESQPTVLAEDPGSFSVKTIGSDASSDHSQASSIPPGPLPWSPDPAVTPRQSPNPKSQAITTHPTSTDLPCLNRLTGLAAIQASRASMVADLAKHTATDTTPASALPSDEEAPATSFEEPPPHDKPSDLHDWKTVSSTKRKAKDSLKTSANAIRKAPEFRSPKKLLISARDLALGITGHKE